MFVRTTTSALLLTAVTFAQGGWDPFDHGVRQEEGLNSGEQLGRSSSVGDWNADGNDDIALGGNGFVRVFSGRGGEQLGQATGAGRTGFGIGCVFGQFDTDPRLDLAVLSSTGGSVTVYRNGSMFSVGAIFQAFAGRSNIRQIEAADLDGDGIHEIVVADSLAAVGGRTSAGEIRAFAAGTGALIASMTGGEAIGRLGQRLARRNGVGSGATDALFASQPGWNSGQGRIVEAGLVSGVLQVVDEFTLVTPNGNLGASALETDGECIAVGSIDNVAVYDAVLGDWIVDLDAENAGDGRGDSVAFGADDSLLFTDLGPRRGGTAFQVQNIHASPPQITPLFHGTDGSLLRFVGDGTIAPFDDGNDYFATTQPFAPNSRGRAAAGNLIVWSDDPLQCQTDRSRIIPGGSAQIDFKFDPSHAGDTIMTLLSATNGGTVQLPNVTLHITVDFLTELTPFLVTPFLATADANGDASVTINMPSFDTFGRTYAFNVTGCTVRNGVINDAADHGMGMHIR